jgi:hypothetical protein
MNSGAIRCERSCHRFSRLPGKRAGPYSHDS